MLATIENFYLNMLRVVILVAATLALFGFVLGLSKVGPMAISYFAPQAAVGGAANPSLSDFAAEQKASGNTAPDAADTTSAPATDTDSDAMKSAITHLASYNANRMGGGLDMSAAKSVLDGKHDSVSADDQADYDSSLNALMNQLDHSTGAPLSVEQVDQLIDWHLAKFTAAVAAKQAALAEQRQQGLIGLGAAGVGLVTFVLLVFCFLFVKIERNLRLVRTLETGAVGQAAIH